MVVAVDAVGQFIGHGLAGQGGTGLQQSTSDCCAGTGWLRSQSGLPAPVGWPATSNKVLGRG
jgi:hypothetical protein